MSRDDRLVDTTPMQVIELPGVEHWRLHRDDDKLLWLALDCAGASTNTLSAAVLGELAVALDAASEARPRGLVLHSAKPNGFAAGADIRAFDDMLDPDRGAKEGWAVYRKGLENYLDWLEASAPSIRNGEAKPLERE